MVDAPKDIYVASKKPETHAQPILMITADNTHDLEFFYPYYRFIEAGYHVDVATPSGGEFKGKMGMGLKDTKSIRNVAASQYQLIYIPGGSAPKELRKNEDVLAIIRAFVQSKKPIAAICHAAQVLVSAGVVQGHKIAAWPEVQEEIEEAGGEFANEPCVVDGQFITARWPGDLPLHLETTLNVLAEQEAQQQKMQKHKAIA